MPATRPLISLMAVCTAWCAWLGSIVGVGAAEGTLSVQPPQLRLSGQHAAAQLLVTHVVDGRPHDATHAAEYRIVDPSIVRPGNPGEFHAVSDGRTELEVRAAGLVQRIPVEVVASGTLPPVSFERDVEPVLSRFACNSGPCHGKARGQNGFQLSLLGFDPNFDFAALTQEARGRRVFPAVPERSLLLQKAAAIVPHGGGRRIDPDSPHYQVLLHWIAQGMPRRQANEAHLERIEVAPAERLLAFQETQQLQVIAHYSDGTQRDVTRMASYQSNETGIATVDGAGWIKAGPVPGEAAIMARYMGHIQTVSVLIPLPGDVPASLYAGLPRKNFIDGHVWDKLARLGITPSEPCDDARYLRRVHLDIIGRLPTPTEARAFFSNTAPDKRERLVDSLLTRNEYADHWATKWADLLRPNPYRVGIKAVLNYDQWIREAFRQNQPYDQFVRDLVAARGSTWQNGAVTFFRDRREPDELTTMVSQLFLGIRLECAKCHHHPFEHYGQEHFYGFAAYFSRLGRKGVGISPPISGGEELLFTAQSGAVKHPLTGEVMTPAPLFGEAPEVTENDDPREILARWITSEQNPFFGQVIVNRVWADLMGRGLVEPVDDLRSTNPASNGPLLEALTADFRKHGCDLKHLIRTIVLSHVYGLRSEPSERNVADTRNYSRHYRQRLRAETLLDAVCDITEVPETFPGAPPGTRAVQVWTTRVESLFLDAFGRPDPNRDPPCDRSAEPTVVQVLHLMNSPNLFAKVTSDQGAAARLAAGSLSPPQIVEELYLLCYSRLPSADELAVGTALFAGEPSARRQASEDLLWALLNTPEFVLKD